MSTSKLKLGMPVTITQYFEPFITYNNMWSSYLRNHGIELEPNVFQLERYRPAPSSLTGIITGYKRLTTKTTYRISKYPYMEHDTGAEVMGETCGFVSSESEMVYVVQKSLTKKYFVKKEWIFGMQET